VTTVLDDVQILYVIAAALSLGLLGIIAVGVWRRG
jgi:hypothetical protein